jgi:hypothetical protein
LNYINLFVCLFAFLLGVWCSLCNTSFSSQHVEELRTRNYDGNEVTTTTATTTTTTTTATTTAAAAAAAAYFAGD